MNTRLELAMLQGARRMLGEGLPGSHRRLCDVVTRRLPRHVEVEVFKGVWVPIDLEQGVQRMSWWAERRYEAPTVDVLRSWSVGATHFFDIGANYGFYAYLAAHTGAQVYAFEPNPELHRLMLGVKGANGLARFHPQLLGLSDEETTLPLHVCATDLGWSTFGEHPDQWPIGAEAAMTTFDSWLGQQAIAVPDRPEWVAKIDVEGFELRALRGMRAALEARAFRGLAIELNEFTLRFCGASTEEVTALLEATGYRETTPGRRANRSLNRFFVPG